MPSHLAQLLGPQRQCFSPSATPLCAGQAGPRASWSATPRGGCPAALPSGKAPAGSGPPVGVMERMPASLLSPNPPQPTSSSSSATVTPATALASAAPQAPPGPDPTGYLALCTVPILWGTYNPCIRYLYAEDNPLDPASLTAVRTALSAGALLLPALLGYLYRQGRDAWQRHTQQGRPPGGTTTTTATSNGSGNGSGGGGVQTGATDATALASAQPPSAGQSHGAAGHTHAASDPHHAPLSTVLAVSSDGPADGVAAAAVAAAEAEAEHPSSSAQARAQATLGASQATHIAPSGALSEAEGWREQEGDRQRRGSSLFDEPLKSARLGPVLTRTFSSAITGGLELGLLNFLGTALQVEGLHSTSATRAGFLAEVTAVLTPLVSYAAGYDIPRQMWVAVGVGLVGSTMVAYDTSQAGSPQPTNSAVAAAAAPAAAATAAAAADQPAAAVAGAEPGGNAVSESAAAGAAAAAAPADGGALYDVVPRDAVPDMAILTPVLPAIGTSDGGLADATALGAFTADRVLEGAAAAAAGPANDTLGRAVLAQALADAVSVPLSVGADPIVALGAATAAQGTVAGAQSVAAASSDGVADLLGAAASGVDVAAGGAAVSDAAAAVATLQATAPAVAEVAADAAASAAAAADAAVAAAAPLAITGGETYLLLACLFFSICTVRMGIYAPKMDTVELAAMKKVGLSTCSLLWMATSNLQHGADLGSVFAFPDLSTRTPLSVAVLLYSGLGPGALATYLQVVGLSTVPATTAQVIFSMTPLLTALFAYLLLGGEATGPLAWVGGIIIILAALTAANAQYRQQQEQQEQLLKTAQQEQQ